MQIKAELLLERRVPKQKEVPKKSAAQKTIIEAAHKAIRKPPWGTSPPPPVLPPPSQPQPTKMLHSSASAQRFQRGEIRKTEIFQHRIFSKKKTTWGAWDFHGFCRELSKILTKMFIIRPSSFRNDHQKYSLTCSPLTMRCEGRRCALAALEAGRRLAGRHGRLPHVRVLQQQQPSARNLDLYCT